MKQRPVRRGRQRSGGRARPGVECLEARALPSLFGSPLVQQIPGSALQVRVADFDRDGRADVVTAGADALHVLLGRGDGTFRDPVGYPTGGVNYGAVVGDFNRDGRADVAAANTDGRVYVLLGKGDGTLQAPAGYPAGGATPVDLALGDLNGDGRTDLVVANEGVRSPDADPGGVSVLLGVGDGTFGPPATFSAGAHPYRLAVADLNHDGNPDVAVVNGGRTLLQSDGPIALSVLQGNGDGTFGPAVNRTDVPHPRAVAAADFNADGHTDLAVLSFDGAVVVLPGNGDGRFGTGTSVAVATEPTDEVVADFNGDGKPDLALTNQSDNAAYYLLGRGDGTFAPPAAVPLGFSDFEHLEQGDFNGDRRPDLVVAFSVGEVAVLLNQPVSLTFSRQYVVQLYHTLLDRAADGRGLAFWAGLLDHGVSRFDVVLGFQASTEYQTRLVTTFYRSYLHRVPDPVGLAAAVRFLARGGLTERLQEVLVGAPEYFQLAGGTDDAFLDALYRDALHRPIDPGARGAFRAALDHGVSRTLLARVVFEGDEYRAQLVRSYYTTYLRSAADDFAVPSFVAALRAGVTDEQVRAIFLASDEYVRLTVGVRQAIQASSSRSSASSA